MTNKLVHVVIVWTSFRFDREFPHWLCMSIGMRNPRLLQLGLRMIMRMYISVPS